MCICVYCVYIYVCMYVYIYVHVFVCVYMCVEITTANEGTGFLLL